MRGCHVSSRHTKKKFAKDEARKLRSVGFRARVVKDSGKWAVSTCGKRKGARKF